MPPAIAVAAVAAAGAVAVGVSLTTALVIASVAMAAASLLTEPKMPGSGTSPSDRKQVIRSPASPMVGVVGTAQLGGVLTFAEEVKASDELNLVITIAGHTQPEGTPVIKNVNTVFMDDREIPQGSSHDDKIFIRVYDGSQKTIDDLGSELTSLSSWRNDMVGKGICFAHIRLRYDPELFPSGVPNFVFEVDTLGTTEPPEGEEVDDIDPEPIPSLTSDTILHYLQNHFGAQADEIDFPSFDIAKPICAETVSNGDGGSEPRYTCNGAFNFDEPHKQVIDKMRVTAAGKLTYLYGQFGLQVGAYNGPADFVLTEDDIIGDVTVKPQPDRRSLINTCKGKHVWPDGKFQEVDFPQVYSDDMLQDDGEELVKDLNLEFCHSPYQCQRLAANDIARARLPVISVPCNWRAFECHLGRNIQLHMPSIGFDYKECVVEGWELDPERGVTLTLREDSPEVWTDIVGKVPVLPPDIDLPDPTTVAPVNNIQLTELEADGVWEARITWEHPSPASIYQYRVLLEKEVGSDWIEKLNTTTQGQTVTLNNPESGNYRATVVAINRFDVRSPAVVQPFTFNVPQVSLTALVATVDNSVYPASALLVASVQGAGSFPAESIVYETECKTSTSDWLAAGRGTTTSCRLSSLEEGAHSARMRAVPPFGGASSWIQTEFEVFAADVPSHLTFTPDGSYDRWGYITWQGAGQSWEVGVFQNNTAVWSDTSTDRSCWLDWLDSGDYIVGVRALAGGIRSGWGYINVHIDDLLPPTSLTHAPDTTGTTGGLIKWTVADPRMELTELELLNDSGDVLHTAVTGSPQAIIPVLAPGEYSAMVRGRWRDHLSSWASLVLQITDSIQPPDNLVFTATGESAWLGELTWNSHQLASELVIINSGTAATVLSVTLLSGYYHVPLLAVGDYRFEVRTVGTWSKSDWVSTTVTVGKPDAPTNLQYHETADNPNSAGMLSWEAPATVGVSGYDVVIVDSNDQSVLATRVQSTWLEIGNIANGTFTARVRSVSLLANETSDDIETTFTVSPLASPINLTAEEKLVESGTGFTSQVTLNWQANDIRTQKYDAEYRLASSTSWSGLYSGPSTTASRNGLTAGDYKFRVRALSGAIESGWVETSLTVRGMETAPDDISGLQLSGITGQMAQLSWDTITSVDVINGGSIHVRHTPFIGAAATWATAIPITERLPGNTTLVTVPLLTGTYLVKAVNPADYWSVNAAAVASNMGSLVGYNRVVERTEPSGWPGEKNKATVDSGGSLTFTEDQSNNQPPFYIMDEPMDLGAVFTVRLHLECDGTVYERDTIDERTDPIDSWEMFDGAVAGGTSLQFQVSTTDDDPASGSASWSGWTQFFVGEFRARAFKLRVALVNPTPAAAGTLAGLKLVADVPDRTETGSNISVGTGGKTISYRQPFLAPAVVAINAQGMSTGDYYRITGNTAIGFTIRFYNSSGAGVARTFDYAAVSYGEG